MKPHPYHNDWDCWADVQRDFRMEEKEPTEVLYASYTYENYSGSADVLYRKGRKYYYVNGGHCSCYGLEDQWSPTEYTKRQLIAMFKQPATWGFWHDQKEAMLAILQPKRK